MMYRLLFIAKGFDMQNVFRPSPIKASPLLDPIPSWTEMQRETKAMAVEFDLFWNDSIADGVAYFFRWLGEPRATVLVVWEATGPTHIECRKQGDVLLSGVEAAPVVAEVKRLFHEEGFRPGAKC